MGFFIGFENFFRNFQILSSFPKTILNPMSQIPVASHSINVKNLTTILSIVAYWPLFEIITPLTYFIKVARMFRNIPTEPDLSTIRENGEFEVRVLKFLFFFQNKKVLLETDTGVIASMELFHTAPYRLFQSRIRLQNFGTFFCL